MKDNIDVEGFVTTNGLKLPFDTTKPASQSSPIVQALIDSGAILIGKTNLDQLATGLVGTRSPYGHVTNAFSENHISGGSSSGSGVAVSMGMASFSLGTDTAGSGRVPASFNNIFGYKPSLGLLSTRGVAPACRSLDCVSIFSLTVDDARHVARQTIAYDELHPFSRRDFKSGPRFRDDNVKVRAAVPSDPYFAGDKEALELYENALRALERVNVEIVAIDIEPFNRAAKLLYEGPWVSERFDANRELFSSSSTTNPSLDPTVSKILLESQDLRSCDAFDAFRQLEEIRLETDIMMKDFDCLIHPTVPTLPLLLEDVKNDPIVLNSQCGYYTNHMNLLNMCGLAVPTGLGSKSGLPFGITISSRAGHDDLLFDVADRLQKDLRIDVGCPGLEYISDITETEDASTVIVEEERVLLLAVGAHMRELGLNAQLTQLGGTFVREAETEASYQMLAFENMNPPRPGMFKANKRLFLEIDQVRIMEHT